MSNAWDTEDGKVAQCVLFGCESEPYFALNVCIPDLTRTTTDVGMDSAPANFLQGGKTARGGVVRMVSIDAVRLAFYRDAARVFLLGHDAYPVATTDYDAALIAAVLAVKKEKT